MFFDTINNIYPLHQGDLELTGWKDGDDLPFGWVTVVETAMPNVPENVSLVSGTPIKENNIWYQVWNFVELNEQELVDLTQQRIEKELRKFDLPSLTEE